MTEDSGEVHPDGEKAYTENNKKRKLKTPAQVMALENFYNDHKYPTEEMKAKFAEDIGLTEKQVSGWFCHRRLKDKKTRRDEGNVIGRQDRSSVVIQDRGSGHKQDSCGSTKQTDYRNADPREVESQRLFGNQYMRNADGLDSASSESSSSLQDMHVSGKGGLYEMESSRYLTQNGAITPLDSQFTRNMGYKPSGYLKVKGEIENAAITAVKRQLGRHHRDDGPPLGIEFDPLPPGAFESSAHDVVHEPIDIGNHRQPYSPNLSGLRKHSNIPPRNEAHNSKMHSTDPYFEVENDNNIMVGSGFKDRKSRQQLRQRSPSFKYSNPLPDQNPLSEVHEDSPRITSLFYSKKSRISSKVGAEVLRYDSVPSHHDLYGGNLKTNHPSPHNYDNIIKSKLGHKSEYLSRPSNSVLGNSKSPEVEESGLSSGMVKVGKYFGERDSAKVHREKMHFTDEPPVAKRVIHNYSQQDYGTKALYNETLGRKNQIKGFSEDETAETSSSMG